MKIRLPHIVLLFLIVLLSSCGGSRKVAQKPSGKPTRPTVKIYTPKVEIPTETPDQEITQIRFNNTEEYILFFKDFAIQKMKQYGIPASITLAQGVLESGSGKSELAYKSNNHFGIKCHEWTGERVYHDDDAKGECFRKYPDPRQSYEDHSLFLTTRKRYAGLFQLNPTDYRAWAKGLKNAGYATDPRYPQKLTKIIEDYRLYRFDKEALGATYTQTVNEETKDAVENKPQQGVTVQISTSGIHEVQAGETLYSLSKAYGTTVEQLKNWNRLSDNAISIGQELYVQEPQSATTNKEVLYVVQPGDTLYAIARLTGISVDEIKRLNNLSSNIISVGQQLLIKP